MKYAQIERKPFPYFFVDVGCWECYSVDVKDSIDKNFKYKDERGNNYGIERNLYIASCP